MSNKPLKANDQNKINAIMGKKKKSIEEIHQCPPYLYILSEGTKTEPYYITDLAEAVNCKYARYGFRNRIKVRGTGHSTKSLLKYARGCVEKEFPQAAVVWLMYDKDDFPYDDFDNTQYSAEQSRKNHKREYRVAWSNECIELWFLLHFEDLKVNVGREAYRKKLSGYLQAQGYGEYQKNLKNIYSILKDRTSVAIQRAEKQYQEYQKMPPSQCCPATRVYELVRFLKAYL